MKRVREKMILGRENSKNSRENIYNGADLDIRYSMDKGLKAVGWLSYS